MSMRAFKHLRIDLQRLSACGRTALDYSLSLSWGNWQITGAEIQWRDLFKPAHLGSAEEGWGFTMLLAAATESASLLCRNGVWDGGFETGCVELVSCCRLPESVLICSVSPSIRMKHYRRLSFIVLFTLDVLIPWWAWLRIHWSWALYRPWYIDIFQKQYRIRQWLLYQYTIVWYCGRIWKIGRTQSELLREL